MIFHGFIRILLGVVPNLIDDLLTNFANLGEERGSFRLLLTAHKDISSVADALVTHIEDHQWYRLVDDHRSPANTRCRQIVETKSGLLPEDIRDSGR